MAHTINDFKEGDLVYHVLKPDIKMVIFKVNTIRQTIECEWDVPYTQVKEFPPHVLEKYSVKVKPEDEKEGTHD
jgi:hypothetical protein